MEGGYLKVAKRQRGRLGKKTDLFSPDAFVTAQKPGHLAIMVTGVALGRADQYPSTSSPADAKARGHPYRFRD